MACTCRCSVFLVLCIIGLTSGDPILRLVNVLYRHGDRSPASTFPNDKYKEDAWPQGFGQLSTLGMQMQYGLGQFLGERYQSQNFLNSSYRREEITIRSTDVDRTLMSAQSNLAGLYPPQGDQIFKPNLTWQPIPVHTISKDQDYLLITNGPPCPYYDELYQEVVQSDYVKQVDKENKDFYAELKRNTGVTFDVELGSVYKIEDPLFCEQAHNYTLPKWVTDDTLLKLENLTNIGMTVLFNSTELARLKGGPLVGKMIADMDAKSQNLSLPIKFYMYSAHDTTLAAFMSALKVYNGKQSPYASAVGLELWEDDNGNFNVSMWFRNATDQAVPWNITLPGCRDMCPFAEFKALLKDVVPRNVKAECGATYKKDYSVAIIVGTSLIALILLVIFVYIICRGRQMSRSDGHVRLSQEPDSMA